MTHPPPARSPRRLDCWSSAPQFFFRALPSPGCPCVAGILRPRRPSACVEGARHGKLPLLFRRIARGSTSQMAASSTHKRISGRATPCSPCRSAARNQSQGGPLDCRIPDETFGSARTNNTWDLLCRLTARPIGGPPLIRSGRPAVVAIASPTRAIRTSPAARRMSPMTPTTARLRTRRDPAMSVPARRAGVCGRRC